MGPQQAGSQPQHAQEPSASSSSAPSCPQPVHAEEPVDYIQDPQAPTVAVPPEQIQAWELTAREGRISAPKAKEEPLSKEHAQAEERDAGFSLVVEQRIAEVDNSLGPMATDDLKAIHRTKEEAMLAATAALRGPAPPGTTRNGDHFEFDIPVRCPPNSSKPTCAKSSSTAPRPKVDAMLAIRSAEGATPKRTLPENTMSPPKNVKQRTGLPPTAAGAAEPSKAPPPCARAEGKGGPVSVPKPRPPVPSSVLIVCSGTERIDYPQVEPDTSTPVQGCAGGASAASPMGIDNQTPLPPTEVVTTAAATEAPARERAPSTPWG